MNDSEEIGELPEILRVEDVSAYLGLHQKTVQRYCRDGMIRSAKCGRTYRIRREWLFDFLERGGC